MEMILLRLLESGGPLGVLAATVIIAVGVILFLRARGVIGFAAPPEKDKTLNRLESIAVSVSDIDKRLQDVERDLRQRPNYDDFHQIEIAMVRLEETLHGFGRSTEATRHSVTRIENYLLEYGKLKNV